MCNFWGFVGFEYRKLLRKKVVWVSVLAVMALCILSAVINAIGSYEVEGQTVCSNYQMIQRQKAESRALSGRLLDDELLGEMQAAYSQVGTEEGYTQTMAYWETAFPYSNVFNKARQIGSSSAVRQAGYTAADLYENRDAERLADWDDLKLTDGERAYLSKREAEIAVPYTYQYCDGWTQLMAWLYTIGVMVTLLIAICVPSLFSEDHLRRTDQLVLSSRYGRKPVYLAKIFTGMTFSAGITLLLTLIFAIPTFLIYGTDGADTRMQLLKPEASWNLTAAGMTGIMLLLAMAAALILSAAAMVLAEKSKSSTVPMAVLVSLLIVTNVVSIPDQYRVLSQIWGCLPTTIVSVWNSFSSRLVPAPVPGGYLTVWQAAPLVYAAAAALLLALGYRIYRRFQAGGR